MIDVPGYKITEKIFTSGKTTIYRGYAKKDETPVILKTFSTKYSMLEGNTRLKHEFNVMKNLDIEGVLKTYELVKYGDRLFLVMEYFSGICLKNLIDSNEIGVITLINVAQQLSTILGDIHKFGVIHKDIKPSNIMIDKETGQVKIIDFSISTQSSVEHEMTDITNTLEGTLSYISPEQTGRMNRKTDYRTDYYSLGVTLYEIATRRLPFLSDDPMEMIHNHIAKLPASPKERNSKVPLVISDIIMKLLSKTPEERYQSAYGLIADLNKCLKSFEEKGEIEYFSLGQFDILDRFQISNKLYNRNNEVMTLVDMFKKATCGSKEITFISGPSGIGKTALISEVQRHVSEESGYFISGKFDQLNRDIPYYPFVQAFRQLISHVLTESENRIKIWRDKLLKAFGNNGQIIIDIIPEIELVIGKQPPIQELSAGETRNRFNFLFKNFVNVFADINNPLVIFIDDLQWADFPTIDLITSIMKDINTKYLFIICAYRDNEIEDRHPLQGAFEQIEKDEISVNYIFLLPLNVDHITELICDTFHSNNEKSRALANIIHSKTHGNPFFVNQFLRLLHEEKLIEFDFSDICWKWDINKITQLDITKNVVELLVEKIEKLPQKTQDVLKISSCIGNEFNLGVLSKVYGKSQFETSRELLYAVNEGTIETRSDFYKYLNNHANKPEYDIINEHLSIAFKFSHDYIQQAISSMISEKLKNEIHYKIGMVLSKDSDEHPIEENIFDVVNHLNLGKEFIIQEKDRIELAKLNLTAGKKAKYSASYSYALRYFRSGMELLPETSWQDQYELTYNLYIERAECEYLNIRYDKAEKFFKILLDNVKSDLEKSKVYKIKIILYINQDKAKEAVDIGIEALKLLGMNIPNNPKYIQIIQELLKTKFFLGGRKIEDLLLLPNMSDTYKAAIMDILMSLTPVAYIIDQKLFLLVVLKIVNLSLRYGNSYASVFGYGVYGLLLGSALGNYRDGYRFGKLSLSLNDKINNIDVKAKCYYNFGWFISHWRAHARENITYLRNGFVEGLESGDFVFAAYCSTSIIVTMYSKGDNLNDIDKAIEKYFDFTKQIKYEYISYIFIIIRQAALRLRSNDSIDFNKSDSEEKILEEKIESCNIDAVKALFHVTNLQLAYLEGNYQEALEAANKSQKYIAGAMGLLYSTDYYFYYSLTITSVYDSLAHDEKNKYMVILKKNQKKMKKWSSNCSENFLHKYLLVEGEIARIKSNDQRAITLYNQAIKSAFDNGYMQNVAIGSELTAKLYFNKGFDLIGEAYIEKAMHVYKKWGAFTKVNEINNKYFDSTSALPSVGTNQIVGANGNMLTTNSTSSTSPCFMDLDAIMKASHTISKELVLENILENLMKIAIENAGAQKGFLFMEKNGRFVVEAEGLVNQDIVQVSLPTKDEETFGVPISIINYVSRTEKSVVLDNAGVDSKFGNDCYIQNYRPKSILSIPIIHKGKLVGILYLENNLTTGVFTSERIEVLKLLTVQAATSIENAVMYKKIKELNLNLEDKIEERTKEVHYKNEQLKAEIEERKKIGVEREKLLDELNRNNKLLEKLAITDGLTGLYNHKYIVEKLSDIVNESKRHSKKLAIIMFDLDNFKGINDEFGHQIGDDVLVRVALILKEILRSEDIIGRYGGEEFLIVLPNTDVESAYSVAERIRRNIMNYIRINGELAVTISGGIGTLAYEDASQLIKKADQLLYKAKRNGRNKIEA